METGISNKYQFLPARNQSSTFLFSFLLIFSFFKLKDAIKAGQNSSQFPYKAYIRHHILHIGNYVFCRLRFILAFFSFVFNTLVIIAVSW